jgi:hypothetical protein
MRTKARGPVGKPEPPTWEESCGRGLPKQLDDIGAAMAKRMVI